MDMKMEKGTVMMMMPDGMVKTMPMADKAMMGTDMDMMRKMSMPMSAPMMVMMGSDGMMYTTPDMKMPDGKMMSDVMMKMK